MRQSQFSRYGAISRPVDVPLGAKLFLVSDSDDTTVGPANLAAEFPVDEDGVVRVYTTIQAANNAATANRGDVIAVLPGFSYTLAGVDSWNTAGVQIRGLGQGVNAPRINFSATTSSIDLAASNIRVSNLRLQSGVAAVARGLDLDTGFSGIKVDNCVFEQGAVNTNFRVMMRLGAKHSLVEDNRFLGTDCGNDSISTGSGIRIVGGDPDFSTIRNNFFYGQFDTIGDTSNGGAAIAQDTTNTDDLILKGILIENNKIVSTDTAVAAAVRFSAGYTIKGLFNENRIAVQGDSAATDTVVVALSGLMATQNFLTRSDTTEKLIGETSVKFTDSGN